MRIIEPTYVELHGDDPEPKPFDEFFAKDDNDDLDFLSDLGDLGDDVSTDEFLTGLKKFGGYTDGAGKWGGYVDNNNSMGGYQGGYQGGYMGGYTNMANGSYQQANKEASS